MILVGTDSSSQSGDSYELERNRKRSQRERPLQVTRSLTLEGDTVNSHQRRKQRRRTARRDTEIQRFEHFQVTHHSNPNLPPFRTRIRAWFVKAIYWSVT